jgi:hypothetical protein
VAAVAGGSGVDEPSFELGPQAQERLRALLLGELRAAVARGVPPAKLLERAVRLRRLAERQPPGEGAEVDDLGPHRQSDR